jgi:excisionase family DNA binding protein
MNPREPKLLLSLNEAARLLGISRNTTLHDLIESGKIRAVVVAGRLRVPREEVERVAREGTEPCPYPRKARRGPAPRPVLSLVEEIRNIKI